jgi:hypothetical protein
MKAKDLLICVMLLIGLTACGDFLEPQSPSEYVPRDVSGLQEMLLGNGYPTYSNTVGTNRNLLAYLEIFDDDIEEQTIQNYEWGANDQGKAIAIGAMFTWQSDMFNVMEQNNFPLQDVWSGTYKYILGANAALDYIDKVSGTTEQKSYVKAQALTLRAFYYYLLVNYFGAPYNYDQTALGVPLKLDSDMREEENLMMPRNTVAEVYAQILKDLDQAEQLFASLPANKQFRADYMINLPTVELLKSRIDLYMENWDEAKTYATKVMNDWDFTLMDLNSITQLPDPTLSNSYYNFNTYTNSPEVIWAYGGVSDFTERYNKDKYYGGTKTRKAFIASSSLLNSYDDNDLRRLLYITKEVRVRSASRPSLNIWWQTDGKDVQLPFGKYATSSSFPTTAGTNFALTFRLSEAYLNFAEAAAMSGSETEALDALNTLLAKRYKTGTYTPLSGLTGDALVNKIREERRKELCFEGQRWFDLRRYGMPSFSRQWAGKTYTLEKNDAAYTMQIPDDVMLRNTNLVQNPAAPQRIGH